MARTMEQTPVEIYAWVNGEKVEMESLNYTITRETEPIFTLGSPMPKYMTRGSRSLTGSFAVDKAGYNKIRKRRLMEVLINNHKDNYTVAIKELEVINLMYNKDDDQYLASFIARDLDMKVLEKLEEMTNRQLAKRLLEREY